MNTKISGNSMWLVGEYLARTDHALPSRVPGAKTLTPEQVQDSFQTLQALQRPEKGWAVRTSDLDTLKAQASDALRTVFQALARLPKRLETMANPKSPISAETLANIRANKVHGAAAQSVHKKALFELFRLSNASFERPFQERVREELANVHGPAEAVATDKARKPKLGLAEEQTRRAQTLEALIRLHTGGNMPLSRPLLVDAIAELGCYGGPDAKETLQLLADGARTKNDPGLAEAAVRAMARIDKAGSLRTAQVLLEGGPIPAGGIRSYINALTKELPKLGHSQDLFIPLPGHVDPAAAGMKKVAGSEGSVWDVHGREVKFSLYSIEEPPAQPGGASRTFYFIADDTYFTPRNGVYIDADTGRPFADEGDRLLEGSMLAMAAMSKAAAIRKLGGGDDLRAEDVSKAEETLTPADAPDLLQINDAHLAAIEGLRLKNPAFKDMASLGVMHNGGAAYQPWVRRESVEPLLRDAGPALDEVLATPGDSVNLMEVMLATMPTKVVSDGYMQRLLNQPGAMSPRVQARLQEAHGEGRVGATPNGITLASFDPSRIEGTTQVAPYDANDFSGKTACKLALQEELGLPKNGEAPLFVFGGRISTQKGLTDLLAPLPTGDGTQTPLDVALREFPDLQIIMGGPLDEPEIGEAMQALQERWPDRVRVQFGFVDNRKLMSAGDVFLMPSREEPCGIAQEEAQAMGLPVLYTNTDGLRDTVSPWDPILGTGEGFPCTLTDDADPNLGVDSGSLVGALRSAAKWASAPESQQDALRRNAMTRAKTFCASLWAENVSAFMRHAVNLNDRELGRV